MKNSSCWHSSLGFDNRVTTLGAPWGPLEFIGFLKGPVCHSTVEQVRTLAPDAKSYGYLISLIKPCKDEQFWLLYLNTKVTTDKAHHGTAPQSEHYNVNDPDNNQRSRRL